MTPESITALIASVGLSDKAECEAGTLSGGQKRRLSVAVAFVGAPPLVVLDEPTSGLGTSCRAWLVGAPVCQCMCGCASLSAASTHVFVWCVCARVCAFLSTLCRIDAQRAIVCACLRA